MNKIRAVVFDVDGVLVDAKEWHYLALNRALALFGYTISRYDHLVTYDGLPTVKKLEMLSREHGLPRQLHKLINDLKQLYTLEAIHSKCRPLFSHEYAFSRLKSMGYRLGVASNAVMVSVRTMMEKTNLASFLDLMLSNQDIKKPKPAPDIYLKAMQKLDVAPNETLVVEDNHHGIEAARAAGAHVMVVREITDVTFKNLLREIALAESSEAINTQEGASECRM